MLRRIDKFLAHVCTRCLRCRPVSKGIHHGRWSILNLASGAIFELLSAKDSASWALSLEKLRYRIA